MMSPKLTSALSLAGLIVAAVGFGIGGRWGNSVGTAGTALSAWAIFRQYKEAVPYESELTEASWEKLDRLAYRLYIPASKHGKGRSPIVSLVLLVDGKYIAVVESPDVSPNGDVTIRLSYAPIGRIIIK